MRSFRILRILKINIGKADKQHKIITAIRIINSLLPADSVMTLSTRWMNIKKRCIVILAYPSWIAPSMGTMGPSLPMDKRAQVRLQLCETLDQA